MLVASVLADQNFCDSAVDPKFGKVAAGQPTGLNTVADKLPMPDTFPNEAHEADTTTQP